MEKGRVRVLETWIFHGKIFDRAWKERPWGPKPAELQRQEGQIHVKKGSEISLRSQFLTAVLWPLKFWMEVWTLIFASREEGDGWSCLWETGTCEVWYMWCVWLFKLFTCQNGWDVQLFRICFYTLARLRPLAKYTTETKYLNSSTSSYSCTRCSWALCSTRSYWCEDGWA